MAKKLTKAELAERKVRYAEARKARAAQKKADALKEARAAKRAASKKTKEATAKKTVRRTLEKHAEVIGEELHASGIPLREVGKPGYRESPFVDLHEHLHGIEGVKPSDALRDTLGEEVSGRSDAFYRQSREYTRIRKSLLQGSNGIVVFDLDGCVFDDAWRHQFVVQRGSKNDTFHAYHKASIKDKPFPFSADLVSKIAESGFFIVFITARPEIYRDITKRSLQAYFNFSAAKGIALLMRGDHDTRSTVEIKRELIAEAIADVGAEVFITAYDDRADVTAMYRHEFGINAFVLDKDGLSDPHGVVAANMACISPENEGETFAQGNGDPDPGVSDPLDEIVDAIEGEDSANVAPEISPETPAHPKHVTHEHDVLHGHYFAPDVLDSSANMVRVLNTEFGNSDVKAGDIVALLFPGGVKMVTAADHRMMTAFLDMISGVAMLANSGLKSRVAVDTILLNASAVQSEIYSANHAIDLGL